MFDDSLLDDRDRLLTADVEGLLRAAASAGAQVRATAEVVAELPPRSGDGSWRQQRPRALVLVDRPGVGAAATRLLAALLADAAIPVVRGDVVPRWVGPLDVVFAYSDDPGDLVLAESVFNACHRGAHVVLAAEDEGPLAAAAAGSGTLLPRRLPLPRGFEFHRVFASGLWLAGELGLLRQDLYELADALDVDAEGCAPDKEPFVNPAKSLALRFAERIPLLWGLDRAAAAVCDHGRRALAAHAGVVADARGYSDALRLPALGAAAHAADTDIFADPDDPGTVSAGGGRGRPRLVLVGVDAGDDAVARRTAAVERFADADTLVVSDEFGGGGIAVSAALTALRLEMAALYLGLAMGAVGRNGNLRPSTFASTTG